MTGRNGTAFACRMVLVLFAIVLQSTRAGAVACPSGGAKIQVCVTNPTGAMPTVTVSGVGVGGEITCTNLSQTYTKTIAMLPFETRCFTGTSALPDSGAGLISGNFVHKVQASSGQVQYQKAPVMHSSSGTWATINWTYHPSVITVDSSSDAACGSTTCSAGSCTLRAAIARANSTTVNLTLPVLIRFATLSTPISLSSNCTLDMSRGNVTIDATDSTGSPWIVADRSAAKQSNQDSFPVTVDLNGITQFNITSRGNMLRGLQIKNTIGAGFQTKDLVRIHNATGSAANTLHSLRLDGGMSANCPGGGCTQTADLIDVDNVNNVLIENVEGFSAVDKGVKVGSLGGATWSGRALVRNSWFHNNYRGNVQSTLAGWVQVDWSIAELGGRRISDGAVVDSGANGHVGNGLNGVMSTCYTVSERNTNNGLVAREGGALYLLGDLTCGNQFEGVAVASVSGNESYVNSVGVGAVFNGGRGLKLSGNVAADILDLSGSDYGSHAFSHNDLAPTGKCDVENSGPIGIDVIRSQWTGNSPRTCGTQAVATAPIESPSNADLDIQETFPTNVILKGQTIRIIGEGFNAINGNAVAGDCAIGNDPSDNSCCVEGPSLSNVCPSEGTPPSGGGQCVELQDSVGAWRSLAVRGLNPSMILTEMPVDVVGCKGDDALLRVVKSTSSGPDVDTVAYCTNDDPPTY